MRPIAVVRIGEREWSTDEDFGDIGLTSGSVSLVRQRGKQKAANSANITLDDPRSVLANTLPLPRKLKDVELPPVMVWFGYKPKLELIFVGQMSSFRTTMLPGEVQIAGTDKARGMRKTARVRTIGGASVAQLVREFGKEAGLTVVLPSSGELEAIRFGELLQHNESDADVLGRVLAEVGYEYHIKNERLVVKPANEEPDQTALITVTLGQDVLGQPSFEVDDIIRSRTPNVYDGNGDPVFEDSSVDPETVERLVMLDQTGLTLTSEEFPSYSAQTVERALKAQAKARDVFRGSLVLEARPQIEVDSSLLLRGFGARWSGVWRVSNVLHDLVDGTTSVEIYNGGAP
jgi:phage protein D